MQNIPILDSRLSLAASFVREGSVVADIGTDHAYIPIYLLLTNKSKSTIAADINEGPLERARINADRYGIRDGITFCLADGLSTLPLEEMGVTDIVICGMGGELIASIIDASEYAKKSGVRFILQPMSHAEKLRKKKRKLRAVKTAKPSSLNCSFCFFNKPFKHFEKQR